VFESRCSTAFFLFDLERGKRNHPVEPEAQKFEQIKCREAETNRLPHVENYARLGHLTCSTGGHFTNCPDLEPSPVNSLAHCCSSTLTSGNKLQGIRDRTSEQI
jgi:hypothetical protein